MRVQLIAWILTIAPWWNVGVAAAEGSALTCDASTPGIRDFYSTAMSLTPHTDKVPLYNTMYGMFVMPLLAATNGGAGMKILEIGLGCDYARGNAGKGRTFANSARLWRKLAPRAQLYEAEFDGKCVAHHRALWTQLNIHTLVGDQGNNSVLDSWNKESGGNYNIVIDDGSHSNAGILASFNKLWPEVRAGGLYFIEDLQVGRHAAWDTTHGEAVMSDVLQSWIEQLLVSEKYSTNAGCYSRLKRAPRGAPRCPDEQAPPHVRARQMRTKFPLPMHVAFVFYQTYACVVGKQTADARSTA